MRKIPAKKTRCEIAKEQRAALSPEEPFTPTTSQPAHEIHNTTTRGIGAFRAVTASDSPVRITPAFVPGAPVPGVIDAWIRSVWGRAGRSRYAYSVDGSHFTDSVRSISSPGGIIAETRSVSKTSIRSRTPDRWISIS